MEEMEEEVIIALRIMEKQARYLRDQFRKGQKFGWEEVKPIVKAAGVLLGREDVKEEVRKINFFFLIPLNTFVDWADGIKLKGKGKSKGGTE